MTQTVTRRAVFMMGGPGSGKSFIRAQRYTGLLTIDADAIKAEHPDYDPKAPAALHAWSTGEATRRFYGALAAGLDLVYDGTGATAEKYVRFLLDAKAAGYTTAVCLVTCSVQTAERRNAGRERTVPVEILREKHALIATSFQLVAPHADQVAVVAND